MRFDTFGQAARHWGLRLLGALGAAWLVLPAHPAAAAGDVPIVVERYDALIPEGDVAAVLRGRFDEHLRAQMPGQVKPVPGRATWYRLRLVDEWLSPHEPVLVISDANDLTVHAFEPPDYAGAEYSVYRTDSAQGHARRVLVIPLPHGLQADAPILLRMDASTAVAHEMRVTDMESAQEQELTQARIDLTWPVLHMALLLAALVCLRVNRPRPWLLFMALMASIVLASAYKSGLGFEFWPSNLLAPLGIKANILTAMLVIIFALALTHELLELPHCAPRLAQACKVFMMPLALVAGACVLPLPAIYLLDAASLLLLLSMLLLWASGVVCWRRGQQGAAVFTLAWTPAVAIMTMRTVDLLAKMPTSPVFGWIQGISFAFASLGMLYLLTNARTGHARRCLGDRESHECDTLTGTLTRSATFGHLRTQFLEARLRRHALSIVFVELDPVVCARARPHGRSALDACLCALLPPIGAELRHNDVVGRYGDDCFLIVLPGADAVVAHGIAERIVRRVADLSVRCAADSLSLAVHVGTAAQDESMTTPDALIARIDCACMQGSHAPLGASAPSLVSTLF